jgi:sugar/nucleoside kinase (ribokinase family)
VSDRSIDVIVAGHVCIDVIPRFPAQTPPLERVFQPGRLQAMEQATLSTGGPISNTGLALSKQGLAVALMGRVGADDFGELTRRKLSASANVDGVVVDPESGGSYTVVIAPPGVDRIFLHCTGANDRFGAEDIRVDLCAKAKLFHFGYPPLMRRMYVDGGDELIAVFRKAREAGATTSLDMALPDQNSEAGRADWESILGRLLPFVDFFLPSIEEALFMADRKAYDRFKAKAGPGDLIDCVDGDTYSNLASRFLEWGTAVVALKSGHRGFYARTAAETRFGALGAARPGDLGQWASREIWMPAFQPVEGGSATGSGDSSVAGFLAAFLRGESPDSAVACANAMGYQNLQTLDAVSGIGDWEATKRLAADPDRRQIAFELAAPGWRFDDGARQWIGPNDALGAPAQHS